MSFPVSLSKSCSVPLLVSLWGLASSPAIAQSTDAASPKVPKQVVSTSASALEPTAVNLTTQQKQVTLYATEKQPEKADFFFPVEHTPENPFALETRPYTLEAQLAQTQEPAILPLNEDVSPMGQINQVFDLRDVSPGDWAYEALQNLVSRYNCIAGYPDGTFRGNRALSRYEFAAALNSCWQVMEQTVLAVGDRLARREDFETLQRLIAEFEAELAAVSAQVDGLESRVSVLEDNQFSTTTKLFGQTIFGLQGRTGGPFQIAGQTLNDPDEEIFMSYSTQLSLFTQFDPRSLLFTSFAMGDGSIAPTFSDTIGNYVGLAYLGDTNNQMRLSDLNFRHLIGRNLAVMVGPEGISPVNVFRGSNRIESAGSGPLSSFAQRNPIMAIGAGSGGLGLDWQISTNLSLQGVYAASTPNNPNDGIFGGRNGSTTFGLQAAFAPTDYWDLTFQYINSYSPFGRLFTGIGDDQLILGNTAQAFNLRAPMKTNAFGLGTEWRINPDITFGGWVGYTFSDYLAGLGKVQTLNWMSFLAFPDLGGEGNLGAIYFGQQPRITHSGLQSAADAGQARNVPSFFTNGDLINAGPGGQPGTSFHLEAFYRWRLNDNISITPGVIVIFDPLQNPQNDTITIGALRTTFSF